MKIITVNLPLSYIQIIDGLIGDHALYPSRSELIRVAVREFLLRELEATESLETAFQITPDNHIDKIIKVNGEFFAKVENEIQEEIKIPYKIIEKAGRAKQEPIKIVKDRSHTNAYGERLDDHDVITKRCCKNRS